MAGSEKPQLMPALKHMVLLGKIFQDMMTDTFSTTRSGPHRSDEHRLSRLGDLNLRLNKWHTSLPDSLQWSQWSQTKIVQSHILILHLYYHALLLSLNRHFARPSNGFPQSPTSQEICAASSSTITSLIRGFRTQHGLHTAPLMLVYALVMATITQMHTLNQGHEGVRFLLRALEECAQCYKLAAEVRSRLVPSRSVAGPAPTAPPAQRNETFDLEQDTIRDQMEPTLDASLLDTGMQPSEFSTESLAQDWMLDLDSFDIPGLSNFDGDFHSWLSIGNIR